MEAYVLAGGKSSRMGEDKGLKPLNGQPMIRYILTLLIQEFSQVSIISANQEYHQFQLPLISDIIPDKGPMGGIYTALSHNSAAYLFITSCDLPFITPQLIQEIVSNKEENKSIITSWQGRLNPLFGIYHRTALPFIEQHISNNQLKMIDFLQEIPVKIIETREPLQNINTLQDFRQAEKLL